jgi:hypothetical protein
MKESGSLTGGLPPLNQSASNKRLRKDGDTDDKFKTLHNTMPKPNSSFGDSEKPSNDKTKIKDR